MNEILRRLYQIYPSIGAWAKSNRPSPLWDNPQTAKHAITEYVGPIASGLFMHSHHLNDSDKEFVRRVDVLRALSAVVDAIYHNQNLVDGLFPEEGKHAP